MKLELYSKLLKNKTELNLLFFLVGSQASVSSTCASDTDLIAYTTDKVSIDILQSTSMALNKSLHRNINDQNISVKLFDESTFDNLNRNDFIRFLEYKLTHNKIDKPVKTLFENHFLVRNKKDLLKSVINSLVIQIIWTTFKILENKNLQEYLVSKITKRIYRNIDLVSQHYDVKFEAKEILTLTESNPIIVNIMHNKPLDLSTYYSQYLHEFINKANIYDSIISKTESLFIIDVLKLIFLRTKNQLEDDIIFTSRSHVRS